jgi:hypothetical protein
MKPPEFKPHPWPSLGQAPGPRQAASEFLPWGFQTAAGGGFAELARPEPEPQPEDPAIEDRAKAAREAARACELAREEGFEAGAKQSLAQTQAAQDALATSQLKIKGLEELLKAQRKTAVDMAEQTLGIMLNMLGEGKLAMGADGWLLAFKALLGAAEGRAPRSVSTHPDMVQAAQAALESLPQFADGLRVQGDLAVAPGELIFQADGMAWAASVSDAALRLRDTVAAEAEREREKP